jgi:alginate O-acetyltransferase complex protein AlgJ
VTQSGAQTPPTKPIVVPNADAKTIRDFAADCLSKARAAEKNYQVTVPGKGGWLFFAPELRHVGIGPFWGESALKTSQATVPEQADPLPAILDFKSQLDKAGIELLMVPVPPKAVIFPDMASSKINWKSPVRLDPNHQEFYDLLRARGVAVLDLTPEFLVRRLEPSGALYCRQDTHWSGRATVLAAQRIASEIKNRSSLPLPAKNPFAASWKSVKIDGDLRAGLSGKLPPLETIPLRFVGTRVANATKLEPVATDRKSPLILLGDSHDLVFHAGDDMHAIGAGLPDQIALELGFPVDLIAVRGSGATPARLGLMRRARANPNYLKGKKLVVWCFSAREFTETAGWRNVPIVP